VTPSTDTRTTAQKALDSLTGFEFPTLTGSTNDLSSLSTSFMVPVLTADGVYALSWTATPMTYFKKIDPLSGQIFVAIPDSVTADTPVTLTVTAIPTASRSAAEVSGTEGATKDYSVVIHPIADTATAVAAVLGGLSGNLLDFSGKDDVDHVSGNFELPSVGEFRHRGRVGIGHAGGIEGYDGRRPHADARQSSDWRACQRDGYHIDDDELDGDPHADSQEEGRQRSHWNPRNADHDHRADNNSTAKGRPGRCCPA
jgi:hypothetical protein